MASTVIGSPREPPEHGACLALEADAVATLLLVETIAKGDSIYGAYHMSSVDI